MPSSWQSSHYFREFHDEACRGGRARLSFPFFFDPAFDADVRPIELGLAVVDDKAQRWDGASVHEFSGTYGDYILAKVSKVFPDRLRKAP